MTRYALFDPHKLLLRPLKDRGHDLHWQQCLPLAPIADPYTHPEFGDFVEHLTEARRQGRAVILFIGGHPIKLGLARFLIDLMERRLITLLATKKKRGRSSF